MRTRSAGKARPSKRRQSHKKVLCTPVAGDARPTRSPGTRHGQGAYAGPFSSRGGNSLARTGSRLKTQAKNGGGSLRFTRRLWERKDYPVRQPPDIEAQDTMRRALWLIVRERDAFS